MCVTDYHDMTIAVKVELNLKPTNSIKTVYIFGSMIKCRNHNRKAQNLNIIGSTGCCFFFAAVSLGKTLRSPTNNWWNPRSTLICVLWHWYNVGCWRQCNGTFNQSIFNPFPNNNFCTERVCRRQFWIWWKWQKVLLKDWKHCGKRRNCSFRAISPFPTVFSKDLYCKHVKTKACLGKG